VIIGNVPWVPVFNSLDYQDAMDLETVDQGRWRPSGIMLALRLVTPGQARAAARGSRG
jgi:hypothetical protein